MDDLNPYLELALEAAEKASAFIRQESEKTLEVGYKGDTDLVTHVDLGSEKIIKELLKSKFPEHQILAEEGGAEQGKSEYLWVIDPLDGTTNFTHGYPFFATSIGLTFQQQPVLGAIAVPFLKEMYWGAPRIGAFCNGSPLQVSSCDRLEDSLLVTGFAYDRHTRLDNNYAEFCWFTHRTHGVRRGGAAAVDLAFIAAGRQDGYWERGLSPWDLAAGVALVDLAGGTVTGYGNRPFDLSSGRVVAAGASLHAAITEGLSQVQPLPGAAFGAPEVTAMGS